MTLQFVPPPDWLIQEYANRKSPVQEGLDSLTTAANSYRQIKQQQQTKQNEALGAYVKAFEAGGPAFAEEIAKRIGLQNPPSLPGKTAVQTGGGTAGIVPSPSQETPMDSEGNPIAPQQGPQLPGVREGMAPDLPNGQQRRPASGMGASSPIIDHWNQTMGASGQQQPSQPQAGLPNLPGGENPLDLLKLGKYGSGRLGALENAQKLADAQTARADKGKPVPYFDADGNKKFELPPGGKVVPGSATAGNKVFIGNDEEGNPLFADKGGTITPGSVPSGGPVLPKSSTIPTASTRASAEFADSIVPHIKEMRNLVSEADQKGYIGPAAGRVYNQFMSGKVGTTGNPDADKLLGRLRASDSLLKTGAMRVHFGARGGTQMYDHFSDLLNSGRQSAAMLNGSLDTLESFMQGYSDAGKPKGGRARSGGAKGDPLGIR